jgi:ribosomal protein S18 acetylase RimI-like enzyme
VLFLYELQIASMAQRQGLGRFLMQAVVKIAEKMQMWKTMLTCFKSNIPALRFYTVRPCHPPNDCPF